MIPIMQSRFSNPEGTIHGNCFTACVASILDKQLDEIPDLQADNGEWFKPFYVLIIENGLKFKGTRTRYKHDKDGNIIGEVEDFSKNLKTSKV